MDERSAPNGVFRWRKTILPGVVLLGAALRLPWLGRTFPLNDDYYQIYEALHPSGLMAFLRILRLNPQHVLLDALSTFACAHFGNSLAWLSLPSALSGVAAIALCWLFAARTGRRRAGLASLLLALSVMHAQWSRAIDFYALLTLLSLVQSILFFEVRREPKRWPWYALAAALFLHAHLYAILFLPLHLFCAVWLERNRTKEFVQSLARAWLAACAAFAPWFLWSTSAFLDTNIFSRGLRWNTLSSIPLPEFLAHIPLFLAFAPEVGPHRWWNLDASSLIALILVAAYFSSLFRAVNGRARPALRYAHLCVLYGIAGLTLFDRLYHYPYSYRQLIWILPFYLLCAADGLCLAAERVSRPDPGTALIAVGLIAAALPLHADALRYQIGMMRTQNAIVDEVRQDLRPGGKLAFQRPDTLMDVLYFLDRSAFVREHGIRGDDIFMTPVFPNGVVISAPEGRGVARVDGRMTLGQEDSSWNFYGEIYDMTMERPRVEPR